MITLLRNLLFQLIPTGLALGLLYWISSQIGVWPAFFLWMAVWACLCAGGAMLLQTTAVGEVSWKNSVGGFPLRWGYSFTQGKLWRMVVASWLVWSLLGLAMALVLSRGTSAGAGNVSQGNDGPWSALLFFAWILKGAVLLYLLGVLFKNFQITSNSGRQLLGLILFIVGLLAASIWLKFNGHVRMAGLVAGGPIVLVAVGYGIFVAVMVIFSRPGDWR